MNLKSTDGEQLVLISAAFLSAIHNPNPGKAIVSGMWFVVS